MSQPLALAKSAGQPESSRVDVFRCSERCMRCESSSSRFESQESGAAAYRAVHAQVEAESGACYKPGADRPFADRRLQ